MHTALPMHRSLASSVPFNKRLAPQTPFVSCTVAAYEAPVTTGVEGAVSSLAHFLRAASMVQPASSLAAAFPRCMHPWSGSRHDKSACGARRFDLLSNGVR